MIFYWLCKKSIPKEIGNLTNLEELYLENNPLSDSEKEKIRKLLQIYEGIDL